MKEGQLVQDHLRHMKKISDELAALGSAVAEEEQVVALLISLPPSYTTLVTALEAKGDDLNLKFVQQALINEEQKRLVVKRQWPQAAETPTQYYRWIRKHQDLSKLLKVGATAVTKRVTKPLNVVKRCQRSLIKYFRRIFTVLRLQMMRILSYFLHQLVKCQRRPVSTGF